MSAMPEDAYSSLAGKDARPVLQAVSMADSDMTRRKRNGSFGYCSYCGWKHINSYLSCWNKFPWRTAL